MGIDLRLPNITAQTPEERINQIQSYVYQLVEQLNWALNTVGEESVRQEAIQVLNGGTEAVSTDADKTFNEIKSLIIKSADIVNSYYDSIKRRLDGVYVAESVFGQYREDTSLDIDANTKNITQLYSDLQQITSDVLEINNSLIETNAWIRTGLLEYDESGVPVYGMEVGQKSLVNDEEVFNKYARFTAAGIYFYLPGYSNAVAWMSGQKLYISNAEITGTLTLGNYTFDSTNGLVIKWIGG